MPTAINQAAVETLRARDSALYFPVSIRPLKEIAPAMEVEDKWQAVIRINDDSSEQVIAIHKQNYKLVPNQDVYTLFETAMGESALDMRDIHVEDGVSYDGGRVVRTYRFPRHRFDIARGDHVDLQLKVQNSYDGSCRFGAIMGAFRLVCANGMVVGDTMLNVQGKHTAGLDIEKIAASLGNTIDAFGQQTETWQSWLNCPVPDAIAEQVIRSMRAVSERQQELIITKYQQQKLETGANLWSLYNALTFWSTHTPVAERAEANASAVVLGRERKVANVLQHPVFMLAA